MMKSYFLLPLTVLFAMNTAMAQYAPQAGIAGSTAIVGGSSQFTGWAATCQVQRGWVDIAQPSLGLVASGGVSYGIGSADNFPVSLGDSGVALLTFAAPIVNGAGPDFAVFENGFINGADAEESFMELAFVEVSSDGVNFFRFPAASLTQTDTQVPGAGVYMNARLVNNLAGKYIGFYGTPFDLEELTGKPGLDVNNITHVRIVDVIGSLGEHASLDDSNRVINDPYPTNFPTGGFDLDAVGVLHQGVTGIEDVDGLKISVYPNPVMDELFISSDKDVTARLTDITGNVFWTGNIIGQQAIPVSSLSKGVYFVHIANSKGEAWVQRVVKL